MFGIARVDEADPRPLWASGQGLFRVPSRHSKFPESTEWIDRLPSEKPLDYLAIWHCMWHAQLGPPALDVNKCKEVPGSRPKPQCPPFSLM